MATVKGIVSLIVPAGKAKPSPAIGQALGPMGVNMMEFCKQFNDKSKHLTPEILIPVKLTALSDRTFSFDLKSPATSWFIKRCAGVANGSRLPGTEFVGTITCKHIYEIAKIKQQDAHMNHMELEEICKMICGSARSIGINVITGRTADAVKEGAEVAV